MENLPGKLAGKPGRKAILALSGVLAFGGANSCAPEIDGSIDDTRGQVGQAMSPVWKDFAPMWVQDPAKDNISPNVTWTSDLKGTAIFAAYQAPLTIDKDIYCTTTTDGGKTWTTVIKIDDSALSPGKKINTTANERSAALRRMSDGTYTMNFTSSWGGYYLYESKNFDIGNCKATKDAVKLFGSINDETKDPGYITYAPNGWLYVSPGTTVTKGIFKVDPDTGDATLVGGTSSIQALGQTVWKEDGKLYMGASVPSGCSNVGGYDLCRYELSPDGSKIIGSGLNFNNITGSVKVNTADWEVTPFVDSKDTLYVANDTSGYHKIKGYYAVVSPTTDAGTDSTADAIPDTPPDSPAETTTDTGVGPETGDSTVADGSDAGGDSDAASTDAGDGADADTTGGDSATDSAETGDSSTTSDSSGADDTADTAPDSPTETPKDTGKADTSVGDTGASDTSHETPVQCLGTPFETVATSPSVTVTSCDAENFNGVVTRPTKFAVGSKIIDIMDINGKGAFLRLRAPKGQDVMIGIEGARKWRLKEPRGAVEKYISAQYGHAFGVEDSETGFTLVYGKDGSPISFTVTAVEGLHTVFKFTDESGRTVCDPWTSGKLTGCREIRKIPEGETYTFPIATTPIEQNPPPETKPGCGPCNTIGGNGGSTREQAFGAFALTGLAIAARTARRRKKSVNEAHRHLE